MPQKKRTTQRPENLVRQIAISSVAAGASVSAMHERGQEPRYDGSARLELSGTMVEPIRNARAVEIVLYASDRTSVGTSPTPWVGTIDVDPDKIRPVLFISHQDFDRVFRLALAGRLNHALLVLTKPHYRTAYVIHLSFSTHPEE